MIAEDKVVAGEPDATGRSGLFSRRSFMFGSAAGLGALALAGCAPSGLMSLAEAEKVYGPVPDERFPIPAANINKVNPVARDVFGSGVGGKTVAVAFAVVGTMLAGLWLCLIRYRARSVLASMMGHLATNSVGFTIAWFVTRT